MNLQFVLLIAFPDEATTQGPLTFDEFSGEMNSQSINVHGQHPHTTWFWWTKRCAEGGGGWVMW